MFIHKISGLNLLKSFKLSINHISKMSTDKKLLEQSRNELKSMFFAAAKAASPRTIIEKNIKLENGQLHFKNNVIPINKNVYLIGFGKAAMCMAMNFQIILGDTLKKGIVNCPEISRDVMWKTKDKSKFPYLSSNKITYYEVGENNLPDDRSWRATHKIIDLAESLTAEDTLIVLITGGGSACLYMPRVRIDGEDKLQLIKALQNAGADITELNTVRQKLSMVKGGGLARMAYPASVITFILSDVIGDPLDIIASGPTVYSPKNPKDVLAILEKYNQKVEGDLRACLIGKEVFKDKKLINKKTKQFKHVVNYLLGNNMVAIEAAALEAKNLKLVPIILRNDVSGNVHDVSLAYVFVTTLICRAISQKIEKEEFFNKIKDLPILKLSAEKVDEIYNTIDNMIGDTLILIGGGEPTVKVTGDGKGGRNQELALHFSLDWLAKVKSNPWYAEYDVIMLSAGTDGQDGPTDATGAFGYPAIGPIVQYLYRYLESKAKRQIGIIEAKEYAEKMIEEKRIAEESVVVCKRRELSFFKEPELVRSELKAEVETPEKSEEEILRASIKQTVLTVMEAERLLPENVLKNNDTYNFYSRFKRGQDLFKTGHTDTNVMDLHFISIKKRKCACSFDLDKTQVDLIDEHDLSIDDKTLEEYERQEVDLKMVKEKGDRKLDALDHKKIDHLNITIMDGNFAEPCCSKRRKLPELYKKTK